MHDFISMHEKRSQIAHDISDYVRMFTEMEICNIIE